MLLIVSASLYMRLLIINFLSFVTVKRRDTYPGTLIQRICHVYIRIKGYNILHVNSYRVQHIDVTILLHFSYCVSLPSKYTILKV
jgi:hypothetical protein